jgi:hypothetical protein
MINGLAGTAHTFTGHSDTTAKEYLFPFVFDSDTELETPNYLLGY